MLAGHDIHEGASCSTENVVSSHSTQYPSLERNDPGRQLQSGI